MSAVWGSLPPGMPAGAAHWGRSGIGVLGAEIASAGQHGASPLYNDLDEGDAARAIRWRIRTGPSNGKLVATPEGRVTVSDVSDGVVSFTYQVWTNNVLGVNPATGLDYATATVKVGTVLVSADLPVSRSVVSRVSADMAVSRSVAQLVSVSSPASRSLAVLVSADLAASRTVAALVSASTSVERTIAEWVAGELAVSRGITAAPEVIPETGLTLGETLALVLQQQQAILQAQAASPLAQIVTLLQEVRQQQGDGLLSEVIAKLTELQQLQAAVPAETAAAVGARVVEGGFSADQVLRVLLAPLAGRARGVGTLREEYLGQDGQTVRVAVNFDGSGNRVAVALNP